jgi:hypothetical protein
MFVMEVSRTWAEFLSGKIPGLVVGHVVNTNLTPQGHWYCVGTDQRSVEKWCKRQEQLSLENRL